MITLHSDDYGYDSKVDLRILEQLKHGAISGVSVLITMVKRSSLEALRTHLRKHNSGVALHINLVEGKSILPQRDIPTLVDTYGRFYGLGMFTIRLVLGLISPGDIRREIEAQLLALRKSVRPASLDSHQHIHALSPIAEIVDDLAQKYQIPMKRTYGSVRVFTVISQVKRMVLLSVAYVSYLVAYKKFGLPSSWKKDREISFMSWEGTSFDAASYTSTAIQFVIHPFLPFDSNSSYVGLFYSPSPP